MGTKQDKWTLSGFKFENTVLKIGQFADMFIVRVLTHPKIAKIHQIVGMSILCEFDCNW